MKSSINNVFYVLWWFKRILKLVCLVFVLLFFPTDVLNDNVAFADSDENEANANYRISFIRLFFFILLSGFFFINYFYLMFKIQTLVEIHWLEHNSFIIDQISNSIATLNNNWQRLLSIISKIDSGQELTVDEDLLARREFEWYKK